MEELSLIQRVSVWVLPVLFAITVHEVAHGWVARRLGDPTAMMLGRLTLNPLKHIDPFGTVLVPGLLLLSPAPVIFGWARPVPVTWQNLKKPKRDMALVAIAGPLSNLLMGILWALVVKLGVVFHGLAGWLMEPLIFMGVAGIAVNTILLVLNLLPLPPLDGGRVATGLLPGPLAWKFGRIEPYGMLILVALLLTGLLQSVISLPIVVVQWALSHLAGISPEVFRGVLYALLGM